tara:strand:+ start:56 stop:226 length:171 start_codon:yes stop_codon:yes gene_type:complete
MKEGDLVRVTGFTSAAEKGDIGIITEIFVKDNAAWVLLSSIGKKYISLQSLTKIKE